jgi:hypothetical protein
MKNTVFGIKCRAIWVCLGAALSGVQAHAWTERMEQSWALGEHESRAKARELALEAMRLRAAQAVGKIVESTATLKDGKLREEVRTVGVSMVKISEVKDSLQIGPDGRGTLLVSARVDVDESELQRRAEQMRQDRDTARQVSQLQAENEKLRKGLNELSTSLKAASSATDVVPLLKQQQELMSALRRNETHIGNTFSPGSLLAMADEGDRAWERDRQEIDEKVFDALLALPVMAKVRGVERQANGGLQARVQVGWSLPHEQIWNVFAKHIEVDPRFRAKDRLVFGRRETKRGLNADLVQSYLAEHSVELRLDLGGAQARLPVMLNDGDDRPTCTWGWHHRYGRAGAVQICAQKPDMGAKVNVGGQPQENPVRLALTTQQAADARALRVFWVLLRNGKELRRREVEPSSPAAP